MDIPLHSSSKSVKIKIRISLNHESEKPHFSLRQLQKISILQTSIFPIAKRKIVVPLTC